MLFNKNKHQEIPETWFKFIIFSPSRVLHEQGEKIRGWKNGLLVLDLC